MVKLTSELWINFRVHLFDFDDFLTAQSKLVSARGDIVSKYIQELINKYLELAPLLQKVRGQLFEREHWLLLFGLLGMPQDSLPTLTLGHFLAPAIVEALIKQQKTISALATRAQGEVTIREAVEELKQWAETKNFDLLEHKTYSNKKTVLIKGWKELFTEVGDKQALVGSLKDSPFFGPFKDEATQIELKLQFLDKVLMDLNQIQRKWVYLEPIFNRGCLPQEHARFQRIDESFCGILSDLVENPNVLSLALVPDLSSTVTSLVDQLDRCSRALSDFLETKRSKFPRFYFIGDDDLLEILGQAQNPVVIESHLKKLFTGIHSVDIDGKCIVAIKSSAGEVVVLKQPVEMTEHIDEWLGALQSSMTQTLQQLVHECLQDPNNYARFPSQILCLVQMIRFAQDCERALSVNQLPSYHKILQTTLATLTSLDCSSNELLKKKINNLVLDLIHNIDVVKNLVENKVATTGDWIWQKQLRFYVQPSSRLVELRMMDACFGYSYEYQGNMSKLVHTPLTDKCYLVLTQGMHLGYGGNPYGPAGTGKTESVKALGHEFGRQVLVFNCDEGIDFESMGRIFTGLVKSGAWGCFDEFNRLKEDQLSAVSQQIQTIQAALKNKNPTCELLGRQVEVSGDAGIFVTLNPPSKEYGGRSKLPHNLKQLFRAVAMTIPDVALIAEVMLYAEGFRFAREVGHKVCQVFEFSKQLLSPQRHYDWGLRPLKTVLSHGGQLLQQAKQARTPNIDEKFETSLLIGALKINTLSKLTHEDSVRFKNLLVDVFGSVDVEEISYMSLQQALQASLRELNLQISQNQVGKIIQLNEALNQRMGVVLVGPSGSGKSTLLKVLHHALAKLRRKVVQHVMNPKALEREKLLGHMDHDTREWFDGVLTAAARQVMREEEGTKTWVVCDGDVDPEWIESLNSVLDDNHLLTMPHGERIKFRDNQVNFIFETHDLQFASPATVSRCAIIYLSEEDIETAALLTAWLDTQDAKLQPQLKTWCDDIFLTAVEWCLQANDFVVATTKVGLITSALTHLTNTASLGAFLNGLIWGLGSNLSFKTRPNFAREVFRLGGSASLQPVDASAPLDCYYRAEKKAFVAYDFDEKRQAVAPAAMSIRAPPLVNTVDMQRCRRIIQPWLDTLAPFIVVGPEGVGKSLLLRSALGEQKSTTVAVIHCNAQTRPAHLISKLAETCALFSTNTGRVYRPKVGDRVVLHLKDLNLPSPDAYDTIQLISFLQQLLTYQGFYDDNLEFVTVEKVQIIASMNPSTTVGRHELSTRFTAIVNVLYMDYPADEELKKIYCIYLRNILTLSSQHVAPVPAERADEKVIQRICVTMVVVYKRVCKAFSSDEQRHYLFNPRYLTEWCFSLLRYNLKTDSMLCALVYEAYRIFGDRLVGGESRKKFAEIVSSTFEKYWKSCPSVDALYYSSLTAVSAGTSASRGSLSEVPGSAEEKKSSQSPHTALREVGPVMTKLNADAWAKNLAGGLLTFEREFKQLNMLLFPEILEHLAFCNRVLSKPGGSLLLVGAAGVGRTTAVTLLCHLQRLRFFTPSLGVHYSVKSFRSEIKEVLRVAGVEGLSVCLFVEDHQLLEDAFLEDINGLLSGGEVPGLFTPGEAEQLLGPLQEPYQNSGLDAQFKTCWAFFVARVRENLHVVLSLNPQHPRFLIRCERNPALYTCCSVYWMDTWSDEGLRFVPRVLLTPSLGSDVLQATNSPAATTSNSAQPGAADNAASQDKSGDAKQEGGVLSKVPIETLVDLAVEIHNSSAEAGVAATPVKYISFLHSYLRLFGEHRASQIAKRKHLWKGLSTLRDTANTVDNMSRDAEVKRKEIVMKQAEADASVERITVAMALAAEKKQDGDELQKLLSGVEEQLKQRQSQIAKEVAEVKPLVLKAKEAVGGISKQQLSEVRAYQVPPPVVRGTLAAVCMMMGQNDLTWRAILQFLLGPSLKTQIMDYEARDLTPQMRKDIQKWVADNPESFDPRRVAQVSRAAAPLATWVTANLQYSEVLETVMPLEKELKHATDTLNANTEKLEKCRAEMKNLDAEVKGLRASFQQTTQDVFTLQKVLKETEQVKISAENLLGKLSGERGRWETTIAEMDAALELLPVSSMLAAAFLTYLGGSSEGDRAITLRRWASKAGLKPNSFEYAQFMSTESQIVEWKSKGLPSDNLCLQNAVTIAHSRQVPFIVDPNYQSGAWLLAYLSSDGPNPSKPEVVQQGDARFSNVLENCIRFGKKLVVQECDGVPPVLMPVLRKDLVMSGQRQVVQLGDHQVDWTDGFALYLVTRHANPDVPPNLVALISVVNFTITRSGLEEQLLAQVLRHEQPGLETKKSELLAREEKLKLQQSTLERQLLDVLASVQGDILQNTQLIDSLNQTKSASVEIESALSESRTIAASLNRQREVYRPVASNGSVLFFLVGQLASVNNMYRFSLASFLSLFLKTLKADRPQAPPPDNEGDQNKRDDAKGAAKAIIVHLRSDLKMRVFAYVCRSIFKSDRLMFALHLIHSLHAQLFQEREWESFTGELVVSVGDVDASSDARSSAVALPRWADPSRESDFKAFALAFPELCASLTLGDAQWAAWGKHPEAELKFPQNIKASSFQQMLVVKALRPDRLQASMEWFCRRALKLNDLNPPALSFSRLLTETSKDEPILFVTAAGADPSQDLEEFAMRTVGQGRFTQVAMGSGQERAALELIRSAARDGGWVLLKNLHLVTPWLGVLEKTLSGLLKHDEFRLWLTTEQHSAFPSILLQMSLKISFESPPGLKQNLLSSYEAWDKDVLHRGSAVRAQLFFVLGWFHAILQERRVYIPQGWTKFYEFSIADLRAAASIIDSVLVRCPAVDGGNALSPNFPWSTLWGLLEVAIYGGRLDNEHDDRILFTYIRKFFARENVGTQGARQTTLGPDIKLPVSNAHSDYMGVISALPATDAPFRFGLSGDVEGAVRVLQSASVLAMLKKLSVASSLAQRFDRVAWRAQLGPLLAAWEKLANADNGALLLPPAVLKDQESPVSSFVALESDKVHSIVLLINSALRALDEVLTKSGLLTPQVQADGLCLLRGDTPWRWAKHWPSGPDASAVWVQEVAFRKRRLEKAWLPVVRQGSSALLNEPLTLSDLTRPRSFLNALRQHSSRVMNLPIGALRLAVGWEAAPLPRSAAVRVKLANLLLQGCGFEGGRLSELKAEAPLLCRLPECVLAFVPKEEKNGASPSSLSVPLYYSPTREDFIANFDMPLQGSAEVFVLAGAALFLTSTQ